MVGDLEILEAFHVLLLQYVHSQVPDGLVLKGGVNLRLFFGSVRYSEDMDFDADSRFRPSVRTAIRKGLADPHLKRGMLRIGIEDATPPTVPAKDTGTTLRYKLSIVTAGGITRPTKVEVSFRERAPMDVGIVESAKPSGAALARSGVVDLPVRHYLRLPAIRQKIAALALRTLVQARDVFDLDLLAAPGLAEAEAQALRNEIPDGILQKAMERTLEISYAQYRDTVLEYLEESDRERFEGEVVWDGMCLHARYLIERLVALPGPVTVAWHA